MTRVSTKNTSKVPKAQQQYCVEVVKVQYGFVYVPRTWTRNARNTLAIDHSRVHTKNILNCQQTKTDNNSAN